MRDSPSRTAEAVCFMRAAEQSRSDSARILFDPHSALFLGPALRAGLAAYEASGAVSRFLVDQGLVLGDLATYIVSRHRFIDDHLERALAAKALEQVVLLGAGYDTRAYRFRDALGARPFFEVDFPSTSRRKAQVVKDHAATLSAVQGPPRGGGGLRDPIARRAAPGERVQEGRPHLLRVGGRVDVPHARHREGHAPTLRALAAKGSELAMDFWFFLDAPDLVGTGHRAAVNLFHVFGEPITFGIHPEDVPSFFERLKYEVLDLADAAELRAAVRQGRPARLPGELRPARPGRPDALSSLAIAMREC